MSCAPEMFQRTMEQMLSKFDNAVNYIDDILIFGETKEELKKAEAAVLKQLNDFGILLNDKKCEFMLEKVEFLGHVLSADGIKRWAVERLIIFLIYLIGRRFEMISDQKALKSVFCTDSKPKPRIERWVLRLQALNYVMKYKKGSENIADPLSRLCTLNNNDSFDGDSPFFVLAIMESVAIDITEIQEISRDDAELKVVKKCVTSGKWEDTIAKSFKPFEKEFAIEDDVLIRGTRLVIPKALRNRMLDIAHEGHPGESQMKRRLREKVWWPGMDQEVVTKVKECEGCRLESQPSKPEPMHRKEMPAAPWIDIAIDFLGPLPSGEYLLTIIDYYSRYMEIEVMTIITAKATINRLDRIFLRLGYPRTITLDNGRQFVSEEFHEYCHNKGIYLNYSIPYWPQMNGEIERQNRSLNKRLRISHALGRNWRKDIDDYLMAYHTTPHSVTNQTPSKLMFGRTIRSKIPSLEDVYTVPPNDETTDRDKIQKAKGKELGDRSRKAKESDVNEGDTVLVKRMEPLNKLDMNFGPEEYVVTSKEGPRVKVTNSKSGVSYDRNVAHVKKVKPIQSVITKESTVEMSESNDQTT